MPDTVAQAQGRNFSLTAVDVRPSALSGGRNIVEVILSFADRATAVVERQFLKRQRDRGISVAGDKDVTVL